MQIHDQSDKQDEDDDEYGEPIFYEDNGETVSQDRLFETAGYHDRMASNLISATTVTEVGNLASRHILDENQME